MTESEIIEAAWRAWVEDRYPNRKGHFSLQWAEAVKREGAVSICERDLIGFYDGFRAGAEWQKKQEDK